jgi:hypothetical protein
VAQRRAALDSHKENQDRCLGNGPGATPAFFVCCFV